MSVTTAPDYVSQIHEVGFGGMHWQLHFRSHCTPGFVGALAVERGLGVFSDHNPTLERERLRQVAERPDGNVCLAYTEEGFIVGYVAFYRPEPDNRWGRAKLPELYELGAVEVSRNWRGMGLGKKLLTFCALDPALEDYITISQEFSWHWDLRANGLPVTEYRQKLMAVMNAGGFALYETNEPNIKLFPHNFFMARIGVNTSISAQKVFQHLLTHGDEIEQLSFFN
jgi:acetoin utilization protein AcuA